MNKVELARAYAPDLSDNAALRRLSTWIAYNPELEKELAGTCYKKRQKAFTPKQISLIYKYLGEP